MQHVCAVGGELFGERAKRRIVERVMFERGAFDGETGRARFDQQMSTVEQQLAFESVFRRDCERARDSV